MAYEQSITRFGSWYATLLRLYPKQYRERFAQPMEQTFHDLLRERATEEKRLFGFALWMFVDTFAGTIRENLTVMTMQNRIVRIALVTAFLLLIPLVAMQFTEEVNWDLFDFVVMGALLFGTGLAYELVARKVGATAYRVAVGVALAGAFLLVWVNGAVGIIGSENNPANVMYAGVLAVLVIGAAVARFKPQGMAHALFATAIAQAVVPVIALVVRRSDFSPGVLPVFVLNAFWVALFVVSGLLFLRGAPGRPETGAV